MSLAIHLAAAGAVQRAGTARALSFDPASGGLSGDTLDVDPPPQSLSDPKQEGATEGMRASPEARASSPEASKPSDDRGSRARASATGARERAATSLAGSSGRPAIFGAAGDRSATDLATTLTRAFPQAASADPAWSKAPFGSAGVADVVVVLDEQGRISDTSITGAPSIALRRGIERSLSLLAFRSFTARAAVARLRIAAHVSRDGVHDGLHGDVFALSGGSFSGDLGSAFFALPPRDGAAGRRVDVEMRLLP